jgi:hypothetical protein
MVRALVLGPSTRGPKAFLVAWLGGIAANNKTAAFAGRCFEGAYRGGILFGQGVKYRF